MNDVSVHGAAVAYRVPEDTQGHGGRGFAALIVAAVALWVASAVAYAPMSVTVDGVARRVPAGTTVEGLVRSGVVKAPRGDLLSVTGEVAAPQAGRAPIVFVDGTMADLGTRVSAGAEITSRRGRDVVEAVVTTIAATPVPTVVSGRGPDSRLESIGAPGLAEVKMGAVSRSIVESRTLVAASPMQVKRMPLAPGTKVVALTFDDGPSPGQTEQVLDILKREGVHATFFMLGIHVKGYPALAKRVADEGHTVGSHSYNHPNLTKVSGAVVHDQFLWTQSLIIEATGVTPTWFRAPGGSVNSVVEAEANAFGLRVVRWTTDPTDWRKPPASQITARVVNGVGPGSIVLMHDGGGDRSQTIAALPEIIRQVKERGYRFVTLDEMYASE